MANRYWVGGTSTWASGSTANWSAAVPLSFTASCSGTTLTTVGSPALVVGMTVWGVLGGSLGTITGGSGNTWTVSVGGTFASQTMSAATTGASTPTSVDSAFFTVPASYTVALSGTLTCLDLTVSAGTVTFSSTGGLTISGSMTLIASTSWGAISTLIFDSTTTGRTVTTAGITLSCGVTFNGVGGGWTLGSNFTITGVLTVTNGTFSTSVSNYAVSCAQLSSNNTNIRTISLNGSTVSCSTASTGAINISTVTNLTFNAGTSQINLTNNTTSGISSGGLTFWNVAFTGTTASTLQISGVNTFNTLSFAARTSVGITSVAFNNNQTISTLTLGAGIAAVGRTFFFSNTLGTQRTLAVTTLTAGAADYDFRDIAVTGAAAPLTGTRFGDCLGNSGITFPAAKTVYYRQTGSNSWGVTSPGSWSLTNGGALDAAAFPLAQDTAVFPSATYPASASTTTINASYNIGTIDMSARTGNTMTLTISSAPCVYGNWTNGTGTTLSGSVLLNFFGRGTQNITSAGKTFTHQVRFNTLTGSVVLQDDFVANANTLGAVNVDSGTFNLNGRTATISGSTARFTLAGGTLAFGTNGTLIVGGSNGFSGTAGCFITGTGTINMTSSSAKTFAGAGLSYAGITLNQGAAGTLTITGSNTFANITNTTQPTTVSFTSSTTQTLSNFGLSGTVGSLVTIISSSAGTRATLSKSSGTISPTYVSIKDSDATGGATWDATGTGVVNGGNNAGWIFPAVASSSNMFLVFG